MYGRDPHGTLRRAVIGRARGVQFAFDKRTAYADVPMTLMWLSSCPIARQPAGALLMHVP
jgi:hypothetical protein